MKEAELVLTHFLNCDRSRLYLNQSLCLDKASGLAVSQVLKRRILREPVQYILGQTEFMGFSFKVNPGVLIPRPETEILVEAVIQYAGALKSGPRRILDLGTGSGCIAVSLAKLIKNAKVTACDISSAALEVAKINARLNGVKIDFLQGDLFGALKNKNEKFDIIVSNPPYVACADLPKLARELSYEPRIAFEAGIDGLGLYRKIIPRAPGWLKTGGLLILELGFGQLNNLKGFLNKADRYEIAGSIKDYNNIERVLVARKRG